MMYALVTYANMRGVRAVDRIVELCERDLAFIWLARGQKPKRDAFYDFKGEKLTPEILDDLHYQLLRRLEKEGLITLKELYIDGTKIEIDSCSPLEILKRQTNLTKIADGEGILFVTGKGKIINWY